MERGVGRQDAARLRAVRILLGGRGPVGFQVAQEAF